MNHILLFLPITVSLLSAATRGQGADDGRTDKRVEELRKRETPEALAEAYCVLFRDATDEELRQLTAHPNSGLALAAGWERVRRTVPVARQKNIVCPDKCVLCRFLGLVEGRVQVPVPRVWCTAVEAAKSYGCSSIQFPLLALQHDVEGGYRVPGVNCPVFPEGRVSVRREGDRLLLTLNSRTWSLLDKGYGRPPPVRALLAKDRLFVAVYISAPAPFHLYALDSSSGDVIWSTKVWAEGGFVDYTGVGSHEVEMQVQGNCVVVFGVAGGAMYIETFDTSTGKNMWRFGTGYFRFDSGASPGSSPSSATGPSPDSLPMSDLH
jgi:hypothetical protein